MHQEGVVAIPVSNLSYPDKHAGCPLYNAAFMLHDVTIADGNVQASASFPREIIGHVNARVAEYESK